MNHTNGIWRTVVRSGGRGTVPAAVLRTLGAQPGDLLEFTNLSERQAELIRVEAPRAESQPRHET